MARPTLLVDLQRCIGCYSCAVACKQENGTPVGVNWIKVDEIGPFGEFPNVEGYFLPHGCMHCEDPACVEACRAYVAALGAALEGASPRQAWEVALGAVAGDRPGTAEVGTWLREAEAAPPADFMTHTGSLEEGVVETVRCGGDSDTNGAIAGALLGAVHGREAVPAQWRRAVLSCRPHPAYGGTDNPRPSWLWPVDALEIGERMLLLRD